MEINYILLALIILAVAGVLYISYLIIKRWAIKDAEKSKETPICPKCGSLSMSQAPSPGMPGGSLPVFGAPSRPAKYRCNDCSYEGIFPIISKDMISEYRKQLKKK